MIFTETIASGIFKLNFKSSGKSPDIISKNSQRIFDICKTSLLQVAYTEVKKGETIWLESDPIQENECDKETSEMCPCL